MGVFPIFQLPAEASKMRFEEPYGSQGFNLKSSGIIPTGIYHGYIPDVVETKLFIIPSLTRGDSVAVAENLQHYNLTIRTEQQIVLDFAGHTTFPVYVVIRSTYSITPHPFGGVTDAKIMTVTPAQLQPTDIKICKITAGGPPLVVDNTIPTNRDELGGPLVTVPQMLTDTMRILGTAEYTGPEIRHPGPIPTTPAIINFNLSSPKTVIVAGCAKQILGAEDLDVRFYYKLDGVDRDGIVGAGYDQSGDPVKNIRIGGAFIRFHHLPSGPHTVQACGHVPHPDWTRIVSPISIIVIG